MSAWSPLIRTVECAVADLTSVARGKVVSRADFEALRGCKLPSVVLGVTLTGGEPAAVFGTLLPEAYGDLHLEPDLATAVPVPGREDRMSVICEPTGLQPDARRFSPRAALRRMIGRLADAGLRATVAPELEFFLVERHADGLRAAGVPGGSGSREHALEIASLERTSHFSAYFDALFAACAQQRVPVTGHAHESACGQYEVNFAHGEPLAMADAVWRFKRLARETAVRQGFLATFIAKPFLDQPGSGMHWHVSLQHTASGLNAFSDTEGRDTPALRHFIAGLQHDAPAALALFAPHDHSFDRITRGDASPTTASWGGDDRGVAFRIPPSSAANRRVENRLPGGDANPYLTLAATLGLGQLGLDCAAEPRPVPPALPRSLGEALDALEDNAALRRVLGDALVDLYVGIKRHESAERQAQAQPRQGWDVLHLTEQA
ncbi:glutamine synthetase family protein [Sphaerotilus sp.]|uniref:glutamine synthetase family protein n=1 Tax=Sphaerotilus sp. TaxID=2093942 RepID=UPI002ACE2FDE|nr:glutamine synthetase family protein [Sphaerotilus sp.]MDZ7857000.1 glutamine synthetase family protein [Sphaerotilus sp.]